MYSITTATHKIRALSKKIRVVQGGTSASKTVSILIYLISLAQSDQKKTLASVISESTPHLKRGAIRDFKNIMQGHNYWNDARWNATDSIYTFETSSQIEFFSADQSDKLRGARRDRGFMNEANNMTLDAFDQLEVRTKEFMFVDYNPTNEFWIYEVMQQRPDDCEKIILTYKDCEALSQEIVDSIESRKNRSGWWQVYGLGQLGEVEGKIYKDWAIIDDIPHEARFRGFGLNFGYSNHYAGLVDVYEYNGGYILDERVFALRQKNPALAEAMLNKESNELCVADCAEPKSIDEIKDEGVNIIGCEKGKDSVSNGIALVQDQKISVTKRSTNIIKEYRNYLWQVDKDGKVLNIPEQGFHFIMDAIRYKIVSLIRPPKKGVHIFRPEKAGFNIGQRLAPEQKRSNSYSKYRT